MRNKRGKIEKIRKMSGKSLKRIFLMNSNAFNVNEWDAKIVIKRLAINPFIFSDDAFVLIQLEIFVKKRRFSHEHLNFEITK